MEKHTLPLVIQDLKAKRDSLSLAHEQLKQDNDDWNKMYYCFVSNDRYV